jgi:propanediol utilization protein
MRDEPIPVIATARHVRLQQSHVDALFGAGHALTRIGPLGLPHVFACAETLTVRVAAGALEHVRVVGPTVRQSVVRVSPRDLPLLGLPIDNPPRALRDSKGCTLEGPLGTVVLAEGLVTPRRILSLDPALARNRGVADGATITLALRGDRVREIFDVRVQFTPEVCHLSVDVDDALAADAWAHEAVWPAALSSRPA